ncbi:DNA-binding protein H-NS [Burkholderia sp. b13]|nr:DNA-binding protein H-NS [Burkholderia sp. b13]
MHSNLNCSLEIADTMATYKELQAQLATLIEQAEAAKLQEREAALAQARDLVATYELTEKEVFGQAKRGGPRAHPGAQPKYRDPQTGATWSGRGRAPAWINGKNRNRFLIKD